MIKAEYAVVEDVTMGEADIIPSLLETKDMLDEEKKENEKDKD